MENHTYLIGQYCLFQHRTDQKIPIHLGCDADGDITNNDIMQRRKQRKKTSLKDRSHRRKKILLDTLSALLKRTTTKNHWKENSKTNSRPP